MNGVIPSYKERYSLLRHTIPLFVFHPHVHAYPLMYSCAYTASFLVFLSLSSYAAAAAPPHCCYLSSSPKTGNRGSHPFCIITLSSSHSQSKSRHSLVDDVCIKVSRWICYGAQDLPISSLCSSHIHTYLPCLCIIHTYIHTYIYRSKMMMISSGILMMLTTTMAIPAFDSANKVGR